LQAKRDELRSMVAEAHCSICLDDTTVLDGLTCKPLGKGHFVCNECFTNHVEAEMKREGFTGDVHCPCRVPAMGNCTSDPYALHLIACHASPAAFDELTKGRLLLRERENNARMEKDFQVRLQQEQDKMQELMRQMRQMEAKEAADLFETEKARKHIVENILTLKCPRCGQAFIDFNGCMALTCSRQGCGCGFCARCLKDCGSDAHGHVALCGGNHDVYGSFEQFEHGQVQRKRRMVNEYLLSKSSELRQRIVTACEKDLRDCKVWPL